jgi:hypothetical protein
MPFWARLWNLRAFSLRLAPLVAVGALVGAGLLLVAPWKTPVFVGSCVPASRVDDFGPRIYENHRSISVNRGQVVTVELWTGEGAPDWPWNDVVSSNPAVLRPLPLCPKPVNITSVPLTLTPFKAIASGRSRITAEVKAADRLTFETYVLDVTVNP